MSAKLICHDSRNGEFICLRFISVGIVESCLEVRSLSNVPSKNSGTLKADIAIAPFLQLECHICMINSIADLSLGDLSLYSVRYSSHCLGS